MVIEVDEIRPLVAFASNSILYIFDVNRGRYHGILRGHGGVSAAFLFSRASIVYDSLMPRRSKSTTSQSTLGTRR